jgi:hypothetical protein
MKRVFLPILLLACCVLFSCNLLVKSVPIDTVLWQQDGSYIRFSTNDTTYLGYSQMHYFASSYQAAPASYPGDLIEVNLIKKSGAEGAAYGFFFCCQDYNNFYRVLINGASGNLRIDKKVNGIYTMITETGFWPNVVELLSGINVPNTIQVQEVAANFYTVTIDSMYTFNFSDNELPDSGYIGFYASVGSSLFEDFPFTPADVRFQLTSPVGIP